MIKKTRRKVSDYTRQLLEIVDQYSKVTGDTSPNLLEVAAWAHKQGFEPMRRSVVKMLAADLRRACASDYIADDNGDPVRHRLAYKESRGGKQLSFFFKMEDATPEKMKLNAAWRRRGTLQDMLQLHRDIKYFNKHHNPGDPLTIDANFNPDIAEHEQPPEYQGGDEPNGQPV